jgi:hypothetical protein
VKVRVLIRFMRNNWPGTDGMAECGPYFIADWYRNGRTHHKSFGKKPPTAKQLAELKRDILAGKLDKPNQKPKRKR